MRMHKHKKEKVSVSWVSLPLVMLVVLVGSPGPVVPARAAPSAATTAVLVRGDNAYGRLGPSRAIVRTAPATAMNLSGGATLAAPSHGARRRAPGVVTLAFEPNRGQAASGVRFLARGAGYTVALDAGGVALTISRPGRAALTPTGRGGATRSMKRGMARLPLPQPSIVRLTLLGANPTARARAEHRLRGTVAYLAGLDPRHWLRALPTYAQVRFAQVYPGVDVVYYGRAQHLEYDLQVAPGADPRRIRLAITGTTALSLTPNGDLLLRTPSGVMRQHRPVIYQVVRGVRRPVGGGYTLRGHTVGFRLSAYDRQAPLIIDPVLVYSTYYGVPGSGGRDSGNGIAVDGAGDVYLVGTTTSSSTMTSGYPVELAFVAKFDPTGTQLWIQYVNNALHDDSGFDKAACNSTGMAIALDGQGNVYVTGTYGDATGAYSICLLNSVMWLKIDARNQNPVLRVFGAASDFHYDGKAIAVDSLGTAYITGQTDAQTGYFPVTPGAYQTTNGRDKNPNSITFEDAFVLKIDPTGKEVYGTYLGGSSSDDGLGIAVDGQGDAFVVGSTMGYDFPVTSNALQRQPGHYFAVAFVSELSPDGSQLLYSTYLSGNEGESANGVAVDGQGHIYVVGETNSFDFPTTPSAYSRSCDGDGLCNPIQDCSTGTCKTFNPEDVFLTKLDPTQSGLASLVYSTFFGGTYRDQGEGIALDPHAPGTAYITGPTESTDLPTVDASQAASGGGQDAFVAKVDTTQLGAASLVYSTYLGGSGDDAGHAIAVDQNGVAYVTGNTTSTNFPTLNPAQGTNNDATNSAFITELSPRAPLRVSGLAVSPSSVVGGGSATGMVTLNEAAPTGGASVTLTADNAAATAPATVMIPSGATSATFPVSTQGVGSSTAVVITAVYAGSSVTASLTVNPASTPTTTNTPVPPTSTATNTLVPPTATATRTPVPPPTNTSAPPPPTSTSVPLAPTNTSVSPAPTHTTASAVPTSIGAGVGAPPPPTSAPPPPTSTPLTSSGGAPGTGRHDKSGKPTGASTQAAPRVTTARGRVVSATNPVLVQAVAPARSAVTISLRLTRTIMVASGSRGGRGRTHTRATTVVLYRITLHIHADGKGRVQTRVRLGYNPRTALRATLVVTLHTTRGAAANSLSVVVRPARTTGHGAARH